MVFDRTEYNTLIIDLKKIILDPFLFNNFHISIFRNINTTSYPIIVILAKQNFIIRSKQQRADNNDVKFVYTYTRIEYSTFGD